MATIKVFIVTSVLMLVYIFVSVLAIISFVDIGLKDRANEIYKRVEDQKSSRGRNQDALLAACLYIACRQEDKPRTVKGTY